MTKFESVLHLPVDDLSERRKILSEELNKVIVEQITNDIRAAITKALESLEDGVEIAVDRFDWEFHPESDDEGGTDWWVNYVTAYNGDEVVDLYEYEVEVLHWNGRDTYMESLEDVIREILTDNKEDLFDQNVTEIKL